MCYVLARYPPLVDIARSMIAVHIELSLHLMVTNDMIAIACTAALPHVITQMETHLWYMYMYM